MFTMFVSVISAHLEAVLCMAIIYNIEWMNFQVTKDLTTYFKFFYYEYSSPDMPEMLQF